MFYLPKICKLTEKYFMVFQIFLKYFRKLLQIEKIFEEMLFAFDSLPPPSTYFPTFQKFQFSCATMSRCWL